MKKVITIILTLALVTTSSANSELSTVIPELAINENLLELDSETTTTFPSATEDAPVKPFLLPSALKPFWYGLEIIPLLDEEEPTITNEQSTYYNLSLARFEAPGCVHIKLRCLEETNNITLHAHHDIKIDVEKITAEMSNELSSFEISEVTRDNETDFLVIHMKQSICAEDPYKNETIELHVPFVSKIASDRLNGLYLDYYIDPKSKEKRYLSTTLFAPNHARKAFPCFDEPRFKASFAIKIGRKENSPYKSISNSPLDKSFSSDLLPTGYIWDEFRPTHELPTYVVAMITTDFPSRTIKNGDVEIKLHAPEFLLDRTVKLNLTDIRSEDYTSRNPYLLQDPLLFIENSLNILKDLGIPNKIEKLDIIALPHFFFSAMENWGAITFKYPVILNVENITTMNELLRLNYVAGHEITHQMFGNTLTPASWSYVWLKESFSDYFGRRLISHAMHGVMDDEDFLNNELQKAMRYDQGADTHPLENTIRASSDIGEIYTDIPYRKGASIVRMAEKLLTYPVFLEGLRKLLKEKYDYDSGKYGNFDQDDLFQHLQEAQKKYEILERGLSSNVTVKDIFDPYTKQCGYPVVETRRENGKLFLKQKFYLNWIYQNLSDENITSQLKKKCSINDTNPDQYWWIPVIVRGPFSIDSYVWIPPDGDEMMFEFGNRYRVSSEKGYFRILYSTEELTTMLERLRAKYFNQNYVPYESRSHSTTKILSPVERSQILDDYFAFAFYLRPRESVTRDLFQVINAMMPFETEYVVWNSFLANMEAPFKLFQDSEYFPSLQKFIELLLKPLSPFLDWKLRLTYSSACADTAILAKQMKLIQFKSLILQWQCKVNAEECSDLAGTKVYEFLRSPNSSFPAEESSLLCAAVKNAHDDELETLWNSFEKLYFNEYYSVQKDRYLKALSCAKNETYLNRLLSWTCDETLDFHDVDRVTLIKYVIANPLGRELILEFLSENFKLLYKSASVANPVTEAIKALVDYTSTPQRLEKINAFIERHQEAMEKKKKFLEKMKRKAMLNLSWKEKVSEEIGENFEHYSQNVFSWNTNCLACVRG